MTNSLKSGYYAKMTCIHAFVKGAWCVRIGQTPDGKWVNEYLSKAMTRPQRLYFNTEAEALTDAKWLMS